MIILAATLAAMPVDLQALTAAIERCDREAVQPIFTAELQRRSAAMNAFYAEQASISAERIETADRRRALREAPGQGEGRKQADAAPDTDKDLSLRQLALDDRQRALDERRRVESLLQEAMDLNRQHFLARCATAKR